jgi:uncharacterized membrane protein YgaE (UPF0421/DUF939 family)
MSFVAVTYGYNQYSIFNTNTPTQPLIDIIVSTCLNAINVSIDDKIHTFTNDIKQLLVDMESLKKNITDKPKEDETKSSPEKKTNTKASNNNLIQIMIQRKLRQRPTNRNNLRINYNQSLHRRIYCSLS